MRQTPHILARAASDRMHDATDFYRRFPVPTISAGFAEVGAADKPFAGDARSMTEVLDASAALVVTSPPYFAGKA